MMTLSIETTSPVWEILVLLAADSLLRPSSVASVTGLQVLWSPIVPAARCATLEFPSFPIPGSSFFV